jgi:hypothetical protein
VNPHGANFHLFVTGVVPENEFTELLNSGIALHSDSYGKVTLARAVVLKFCGGVVLLNDEWFLREISSGKILRRSFPRRKVGFSWTFSLLRGDRTHRGKQNEYSNPNTKTLHSNSHCS